MQSPCEIRTTKPTRATGIALDRSANAAKLDSWRSVRQGSRVAETRELTARFVLFSPWAGVETPARFAGLRHGPTLRRFVSAAPNARRVFGSGHHLRQCSDASGECICVGGAEDWERSARYGCFFAQPLLR